MKPGSACLFLGIAALGAVAFGQPPAAPPRLRIGPVYTSDFPNLDIVVEASGSGPSAASIPVSDLILMEDGVRTSAAISSRKFSETGEGVAVLLALDASGSMRGRPLDAVRKGLGQFVSKARDNDKIAVLSFADDVRWETPWSGSREETRRKLEQIQARGRNTVLWDAIDTALDELAKLDGPARRHLVVISDGHDEGSKKSLADVIAKAQSLHIPVDAIGMTRDDPRYLENLQSLSKESKGSYTTAPDLDALTQLMGSSIDRMLDSPVARFRAGKLKADGATHRVGVYWTAANQEDETSLALPAATQQQLPSTPPEQPQAPAPAPVQTTPKMFRWWYAAIPAGAAVLALLSWLFFRRRRTGVPPPGLPDSPASGLPPSVSWLPAPVSPSAAPPPPDSWLPAPVSQSPAPPPPGLPDSPASSPAPARARTLYAPAFPPPARLIAKSGPFAGQTFRIDREDFWVGAAENNNLKLDDETVSGNHAVFRFEAETLKIFDNRSTNDTWVNRQPVGGTARVLFPGDEIRIGQSVFVIERSEEEASKNVAQPGPPLALS